MSPRAGEMVRYLVNGGVATVAHFAVLYLGIEVLRLGSAGLSNALASIVGIAVSFVGNRHFVFRRQERPIAAQAYRFVSLYALIALIHGLVLYGWTDRLGWSYRTGFVLAVMLQVVLGYLASRHLVFGASHTHARYEP